MSMILSSIPASYSCELCRVDAGGGCPIPHASNIMHDQATNASPGKNGEPPHAGGEVAHRLGQDDADGRRLPATGRTPGT